jgi:glutathione S-transferase
MLLYRAPYSTNVERVALALAHKGLEVESVVISYDDRSLVEQVSGQPLVPVLVDDAGLVVAGSMRIVAHVDGLVPEQRLYPDDRARRAELDAFVDWFDGVWKVAPNAIEAELAPGGAADAGRIAQLGASMARALDRFEALLSGRSYLFGDALSAADCCVFPFVKYAARRDPDDRELFHLVLEEHQRLGDDHSRLADWIERIDALPRA